MNFLKEGKYNVQCMLSNDVLFLGLLIFYCDAQEHNAGDRCILDYAFGMKNNR